MWAWISQGEPYMYNSKNDIYTWGGGENVQLSQEKHRKTAMESVSRIPGMISYFWIWSFLQDFFILNFKLHEWFSANCSYKVLIQNKNESKT